MDTRHIVVYFATHTNIHDVFAVMGSAEHTLNLPLTKVGCRILSTLLSGDVVGFSNQTVKIGHPRMMLKEKNLMIMTKYHC